MPPASSPGRMATCIPAILASHRMTPTSARRRRRLVRVTPPAALFGDLNAPGPYVVLMRWHPGYMSAPHTYTTGRVSMVLSGAWWVNSGADFDPNNTVPVPAGGFVRRVAHTPHFDGVKRGARPRSTPIPPF